MAHRIYQYDKQQGIDMGWHGLTEVVPDISLDKNWLRDWELVPVKLEKAGIPTKWTILECSDDRSIEIGQPYNPGTFSPVNNADFLQMIKDSISGTPHIVSSVGSVRNRGRVFVSIKLMGMEKFQAAGRDFSAFLNFGNGHDKSSVLWVNTSNICTVCDNTFSCNLLSVENTASVNNDSDDLRIRQRHTKNVRLKLPEISGIVDKAIGVQAEFQLELNRLDQIGIDMVEVKPLFAGFIGKNRITTEKKLSTRAINTVNRLTELFSRGNGNNGRTLADAFQAVTDYYTHFSSGGSDNPMRQFISSEYGSGQIAKQQFLDVLGNEEVFEKTHELGKELLVNSNA